MSVFSNSLRKIQAIFPKAMLDLGVGWIHFHKITPTDSKKVFGYGGLFVTLFVTCLHIF
jgi:hypothetical protein